MKRFFSTDGAEKKLIFRRPFSNGYTPLPTNLYSVDGSVRRLYMVHVIKFDYWPYRSV